ncbi:hypothetical protein BH24ACI3_BH24ACI3_17480 [soil metagenome]
MAQITSCLTFPPIPKAIQAMVDNSGQRLGTHRNLDISEKEKYNVRNDKKNS